MLPKVIGDTLFQVLPSDTSFLLKIKDMDSLGLIFDNLRNFLVHGTDEILVFRNVGTLFFSKKLTQVALLLNICCLTETEPRRLYRRIGHPLTARFIRAMRRSG